MLWYIPCRYPNESPSCEAEGALADCLRNVSEKMKRKRLHELFRMPGFRKPKYLPPV
jgi:hypothetical protein